MATNPSALKTTTGSTKSNLPGLIAVAVLPALAGLTGTSYLHPAALAHGFRVAALMAAAFCAAGGLLAAAAIRNPPRARRAGTPRLAAHCGLDAPPLPSPDTLPSPEPPRQDAR